MPRDRPDVVNTLIFQKKDATVGKDKQKHMRSAVSIFLIIILVPVTMVMLLVTSVKSNLLTSRFLKAELTRQNLYALATKQIDEQVLKLKIDPQYPITHAEITDMVHSVLSEAWLRQNVESLLDQFFSWLDKPSGVALNLTVDLRQPKTELFQRVDDLLATKLPQIQPCPQSRSRQRPEGICNFAGMTVAQVKTELAHLGFDLPAMQQRLPDTLDLLHPDLSAVFGPPDAAKPDSTQAQTPKFLSDLERVKTIYRQALQYYRYALMGLGLLVILYLAVNIKGWRRLARWTGILALSVGVLPLVLGIASRPVVEQQVIPTLNLDPKLPAELQRAVPTAILDVQQALFSPLSVVGIILVVAGLGAIIGAHWIPPVMKKRGS